MSIAIAYRNMSYIADDALPRTPVGKKDFQYLLWALGDSFTVPDTKVGRKSEPTMVDFSATSTAASVQDCGLDDFVPQDDIDNAPPQYDPLGRATEGLTDLVMLDREVRTAALIFGSANYATANKRTLSGTSQWSDHTNSTPSNDILAALDVPILRPNTAVFGRATWTQLVNHPDIIKAVFGTASTKGVVSREAFANTFELEQVLVGESWLNSVKPGQTVSLARVWGKHASFYYRNKLADTQRGPTFGLTAQFEQRVAGSLPEPRIGLRGGQRVRVGESVKEVITAPELGYMFVNAVA